MSKFKDVLKRKNIYSEIINSYKNSSQTAHGKLSRLNIFTQR